MRAILLAGGKGTRLRPLTHIIPKPLLPIDQRPILEHIIEYLKSFGITDITISVGYMGEKIREYFGDGSVWGVNIEYTEEKEPLGTAGCLALLKDKPKETFLVMAGDNITTFDLGKFIKFHKEKKAVASVALVEIEVPVDFGIAETDETQKIINFMEKPTFKYHASTMIYLVEPEVLDYVEPGNDFAKDIFPKLLSKGFGVYGYKFSDFWADIGSMTEYWKLSGFKIQGD